MHIAIDARLYGLKNRGLGRFLIEHLKGLEAVDEQNSYSVFLRKENFDEYQPKNRNFKKVLWDVPWYTLKEQRDTTALESVNADVYHFPHWNVPVKLKKPWVATIHDMILFDCPDRRSSKLSWWKYWLKYIAFRYLMRAVLHRAKAIVAVSASTKNAIVKYFPQTKGIEVIYEGAPELAAAEPFDLGKHGIKKPYIMYVGAAYPHKNLSFLLRSFQKVRETLDCELVLVGRKDFFYERLELEAREKDLDRGVVFFGSATDGQLSYLYDNAQASVSPALVEGFGFNGLESMAKHVPVAAARIACFEEIFGNAPEYFDPKDEADCARAMVVVLSGGDSHTQYIEAGKKIPGRYDWKESAQQYKQLFEKLGH